MWECGIYSCQVSHKPVSARAPAPVESLVALEIPLRLHRVEIRTTTAQQLVTVIEILTGQQAAEPRGASGLPAETAGLPALRGASARARSAARWRATPLERPVPSAPYYVMLSRAERRPRWDVWPIQLMDHLPVLPVPLLEPDPDVPVT